MLPGFTGKHNSGRARFRVDTRVGAVSHLIHRPDPRAKFGQTCPPVQNVRGMGLARLDNGEYHKVVLMKLGLVPAQAFRASRSEAAPYGSDNGKPN
jgi:hypothetical protein